MKITNFKTFVKEACDGCESIAYRYLDDIATHEMEIGNYGQDFEYNDNENEFCLYFDLVKPQIINEDGDEIAEPVYRVRIYKNK